jgi:hypothetical protein
MINFLVIPECILMCMHNHCKTIVNKRFMTEHVYDYYYTGHPSRVTNMRTDQLTWQM